MNAYSKDLRLGVLTAIDRGMPGKQIVKTFGVSLATLVEAMGRALEAVTPQDAKGWFGHCGYEVSAG